jgi:hypothetical protein
MKKTKAPLWATLLVVMLTLSFPASEAGAALIAPNSNAEAIAGAINSQPGLVTGASWPAQPEAENPSGSLAAGVGDGFTGLYMPDAGPSFGVLSTGNVELADPPNNSDSAGEDNGQETRNVHDLSVLKLDVTVPPGDDCLSFDLAFYSEEYPEFVGSAYDDGFLAELDANSWTYDPESSTVDAPANFAFDEEHHLLTVNSANFTAAGETGLQYDGSTQLLEAATPVKPGAHSVYLSLFDAGDGIYDSAAFLDNLRTRAVPASDCAAGATVADSDGDAIPDRWEEEGYDANNDGVVDVNLPAMGADPQHKDLFVELDAMKGLRLSQQAIGKVVASFAAAPVSNPDGAPGIALHVDNGSSSLMDPATGATWGSLSRATDFGYIPHLGYFNGNNYNWSAFDTLKQSFFPAAREPIFHYALSVNRYGDSGSSGISRDIGASDFIVALGHACSPEGACPGPVNAQAGTFMHELGHNLGLRHGGRDDIHHKPNYLSVMNYSFQFTGLLGGGMDYSRFDGSDIPSLDENHLYEGAGFDTSVTGYKTLIGCDFGGNKVWGVASISGPVDFNCDGDSGDSNVGRDLNFDGGKSVLQNFDDWNWVQLKGGAVGGEGLASLLPEETESEEPPASEIEEAAEALVPPPGLSVGPVTGITPSSADVHAGADPNGRPLEVAVQFGRTPEYGAQTPFQEVGEGDEAVAVTIPLSGLEGGVYHYQVIARTPEHLVFSADSTFNTDEPSAPPPSGPSYSPLTGPVTEPVSTQRRLRCKKGFQVKHIHGKRRCVKKKPRHHRHKHRHG